MHKILIKNIQQLAQVRDTNIQTVKGKDMAELPSIFNAWLAIENDLIVGYGSMNDWQGISDWSNLEVIDASGKIVLPTYCDSHTHIVFAGSREAEFVDRINGLSYEEIALRGGGIINSAVKMHTASENELYQNALKRINEMIAQGSGAIEIKSGYGLSLETEIKMLRVIDKLKKSLPIPIKSTFLGAHAVPPKYKQNKQKYIDLILNEMLPAIANEGLADYCDVFCERNYFTPDETLTILMAAKKYGILPKVHAEQLSNSGGVLAGIKAGAVSVDHLEFVGDVEIEHLLQCNTMPVILPGAAFFLSLPHPPAKKMIDAGLPLAIASDFNPGSSPSGNMNLMNAIACIQYGLTPEQTINASTLNGAYAMGLSQNYGSIAIGKKANFMITKEIPSLAFLPYSFGSNLIEQTFINGKLYIGSL
ncbi:MAG TPA: imidazolonepropionase [Bacteroidia bacterium]|nr:imidazolonepropionase [Bacteroidia bacterium]